MDARSDLYSVGIMLFQLVTGRLPFEADSPLAIAYAHVQEEPVAPSSVNRALPPAVDALVARALKKNPNERFPTAEAMRDECLRIAQSLQPAAPSIVPGQQTQSGAGVGSAVFPPVGQQPPSTGPVQTPYQPGPYGAQTPAPAQHHPAPTPTPGYGYPQQSGYGTPQPYGHQQAPATPPPYATVQQSGSGSTGGKRQMPLIVGSIVVALLAIGGLVTALALQKDDDSQAGGSGDPGSSQGEGKDGEKPGFRGPDLTKTMETEECTDPDESYNDPEKIRVPDFTFTNITFVKKCLQAAKWKYDTTSVDENAYGKDTVMRQSPKAGTEVDPDDMPSIQLDVSSGNPS